MRQSHGWSLLLGMVCLGIGAGHAIPAELWADSRLPVTDGLGLWLDASGLGQAAKANGTAGPVPEGPVGRWYDGSGHGRDVSQGRVQSCPTYLNDLISVEGVAHRPAILRFDGWDDTLTARAAGWATEEITLFLVGSAHSNRGGFSAFVAANAPGENDYTSGLTVDQGGAGSAQFNSINVEGRGFSGSRDLLKSAKEFGTFHILTITSKSEDDGTTLYVDSTREGTRPRSEGRLSLDEWHVGARHCSNTAKKPYDQGFLHGDVAEVLAYDRVLAPDERTRVEDYLRDKYGPLLAHQVLPSEQVVHALVSGMTVRELPVQLTNLNNLCYGANKELYATGYDGRIHVITDSDGDGLEDTVKPYWYEPTLREPISTVWSEEGIYVTSYAKVSLLRDTDGDRRADVEEIVGNDWIRSDLPDHSVECLGLTKDGEGNIYFGLGCADYTNAYRVKDGNPHYDLGSDRGTIQKLSADRKTREIVCTGIRYPYTLAFNRHGDLFCTDQEGETWLPGGNPLDELNYIIPGRHYGFPPRHETYLPDVYDEPPVIGFGPQHQSSCGMVFNERKDHQAPFGPAHWHNDALVAGFSRGKIWRCTLVKTSAGYVGKPTMILRSRMLLTDMALSDTGEMVFACHSGNPDWGTGPKGPGKLFKLVYSDPSAPQPVAAWPHGPLETRIAFDRPLGAGAADQMIGRSIAFGENVTAADRYEVLFPPYKAVANQQRAYRGEIRIVGASLSGDRRTLSLATDPHPFRAAYALTIPRVGPKGETVDLAYDLTGVSAVWTNNDKNAAEDWRGWLPHFDLQVAAEMTVGSAQHVSFFKSIQSPGRLELHARVQMPASRTTFLIESNAPLTATLDDVAVQAKPGPDRMYQADLTADAGKPFGDLRIELPTGTTRPELAVTHKTAADPTVRPIPLTRLLAPWAPTASPPVPVDSAGAAAPELAGGNFDRGRELFFGDQLKCGQCHLVRGEGGKIGPDLSNLIHRDYASVRTDITEPNATLNPDYVNYLIWKKDGTSLDGLVHSESADTLRVINATHLEGVLVNRKDIDEIRPSALSIMPEDVVKSLSEDQVKDLITFLLTAESPEPAPSTPAPPKPRSRPEVDRALAALTPSPEASRVDNLLNVVLCAGAQDHGPGEHDYPAWRENWKKLLSVDDKVRVSTAHDWPAAEQWTDADVVVFYFWNHDWTDARYADLDRHLAKGRGLVFLHSATIADTQAEKLAERIGWAYDPERCKYRHGPLDLKLLDSGMPVTAGTGTIHFYDESYWPMIGKGRGVKVLATTVEEGQDRPMAWTCQKGPGRVFCSILGHYSWTFDDPLFRVLALRGMSWAAGARPGRLDALVKHGVQMRD